VNANRFAWLILFGVLAAAQTSAQAPLAPEDETSDIVFVCEHGSVKSLMATTFFNNAARERGLPFRAVSRGVTPDPAVPPKITAALAAEGFDARDFKPTAVSTAELSRAKRIVAIGVDLTPLAPTQAVIERWDDVPAASIDYPAARRSLKQHVEQLLRELRSVE
jgi:arsenate reductase